MAHASTPGPIAEEGAHASNETEEDKTEQAVENLRNSEAATMGGMPPVPKYSRRHHESNGKIWYLQMFEIDCIVLLHSHQVESARQ